MTPEPVMTLWRCSLGHLAEGDGRLCRYEGCTRVAPVEEPVFSERDMQAAQEAAEEWEKNARSAHAREMAYKSQLDVTRAAIDAALQTTWEVDEDGGWGTAEETLFPGRLTALEALQPHWQAWGDQAWDMAGRDSERAGKLAEALRELREAWRNAASYLKGNQIKAAERQADAALEAVATAPSRQRGGQAS